MIPILAALVQKNINFNTNSKNYSSFILIVLILFISLKFHFRYNVDRKFIDLENIDKTQAINAQDIHQNFNNLKWISRYSSPKEDKAFIKKVIQSLKNEDKNSYVITHYQFFSTILKKNFYILNRWYIWDNNSHPTESHKYFKYYKNFVLENFRKNSIKTIYLINETEEIKFSNIENYFEDICFNQENIIEKKFIKLTVKNCI